MRRGIPPGSTRTRLWPPVDVAAVAVILAILTVLAFTRREFIGDGLRHITAALAATRPYPGEARWLLHPFTVFVMLRPLSWLGIVGGVASGARALLVVSICAAAVYLLAVRAWLREECADRRRRAAALLLCGGCAPFLSLYTDIAEPQLGAALSVAALAYARRLHGTSGGERAAALAAIAVGVSSLLYQGLILGLGLLPLATNWRVATRPRVLAAVSLAIMLLPAAAAMSAAAAGRPVLPALRLVASGESNPLMREWMVDRRPGKVVAAVIAGPPQGIVGLQRFTGLPALARGLASDSPGAALVEAARLALGLVVVLTLIRVGIGARAWNVAFAAVLLMALPIFRNQQYNYSKFYILWPLLTALVAVKGRTRTMATLALVVLASNLVVVGRAVADGRRVYAAAQRAYADATPQTCWLSIGSEPRISQLWPGTKVGILVTLATGTEQSVQQRLLATKLQNCFCGADAVWTDIAPDTLRSSDRALRYFRFPEIDDAALRQATPTPFAPGIYIFSSLDRRRLCELFRAPSVPRP